MIRYTRLICSGLFFMGCGYAQDLKSPDASPHALSIPFSEHMVARTSVPTTHITLQGLNKITGRVSTLETGIDKPVSFGTLNIRVMKCLKTPPEELPEAVAFLEIDEEKNTAPVFRGWMFSSNPSISALEHPVFDVWVKDCSNNAQTVSYEDTLPAAKRDSVPSDASSMQPSHPSNPTGLFDEADEMPLMGEPDVRDKSQLDSLYQKLED